MAGFDFPSVWYTCLAWPASFSPVIRAYSGNVSGRMRLGWRSACHSLSGRPSASRWRARTMALYAFLPFSLRR